MIIGFGARSVFVSLHKHLHKWYEITKYSYKIILYHLLKCLGRLTKRALAPKPIIIDP